jgi:hypothetical protein
MNLLLRIKRKSFNTYFVIRQIQCFIWLAIQNKFIQNKLSMKSFLLHRRLVLEA